MTAINLTEIKKSLDEQFQELSEREKARYEEWAAERGDHVRTFRRAILFVTPDLIMWMGGGAFECVTHPLPKDAKRVGAFYDEKKDMFGVVIESEEFEEVREGALLPHLPPPFFERFKASINNG